MSYSFGGNGAIADVRKQVSGASEYLHGARLAKTLIHHQLDLLEAQGATHVTVNAYGDCNGSAHNITIKRDETAEANHRADTLAKNTDAYLDQGKALGIIQEDETDGAIRIHIPERSVRARHRGAEAKVYDTIAAGAQAKGQNASPDGENRKGSTGTQTKSPS